MPRVLSPKTHDNKYNVQAYGAKGDGTTDDTAALNACLLAVYNAGGGTIVVPPGSYKTSAPLIIRRNTTLICDNGVTFFRSASGSLIMNGDYNEDQSVYTGHGNIRIVGGVWDMKGTTVTNGNIAIALAHGNDISIEGVTIKDVPQNHAIEVNSSKTVRIRDCKFLGYYATDGGAVNYNEAVQIDLALTGGSTFGAFGLYDDTPCDDILVTGCYFGASGTASTTAWYRGVGGHSGKAGFEHTNVRITDNHFDGLLNIAVGLYGFRRTVVADNAFDGCGAMVYANSASSQDFGNISITGNVAKDCTLNQAAITIAPATGTATGIVVSGNAIDGVTGGTSGHGIDMSRSTYVNVTGNTIANVGGAGIRFVGTCNQVQVTNNIISDVGDAGVQVTNSNNCVVSDNVVHNPAKNGIYSTGPAGLTVTGNTITQYAQVAGTFYGIRMSTSGSNYTITNNTIRRSSGSGTDGGAINITASLTGGYTLRNDTGALTVTDAGTSRSAREALDLGPEIYTLAADFTSTSTTAAAVLTSDTLPAGTYLVEATVYNSSTGTTSSKLNFATSGTASSYIAQGEWWATATTKSSSSASITTIGSGGAVVVPTAVANNVRPANLWARVVLSAAGAISLQGASNTAASNVTLKAGTWLRVTPAN